MVRYLAVVCSVLLIVLAVPGAEPQPTVT